MSNVTGILIRRGKESDMHRGKAMSRYREKAICQTKREASGKTNSADTLISAF